MFRITGFCLEAFTDAALSIIASSSIFRSTQPRERRAIKERSFEADNYIYQVPGESRYERIDSSLTPQLKLPAQSLSHFLFCLSHLCVFLLLKSKDEAAVK